jgi:hypothetical protein
MPKLSRVATLTKRIKHFKVSRCIPSLRLNTQNSEDREKKGSQTLDKREV